ncbi:I78 family peptidase inhibitor [Vreelandella olivaria]|uniref:I78 family peptidase inhibitor n=1 Tax=Vreelandella olivaria TaxID=390919 RepID=UPI00201FB2BB|nr:I78 family peptidase inhibitor [Halomonas olivaria]
MGNLQRCSVKKLAMNGFVVLLTATLLAACASVPDDESAPPPPTVGQEEVSSAGATCNIDTIQYAIGEPFDEANVPQLQSESSARQVRVLRPGSAATMDYREDRLNIHLESNDMIEALRCG